MWQILELPPPPSFFSILVPFPVSDPLPSPLPSPLPPPSLSPSQPALPSPLPSPFPSPFPSPSLSYIRYLASSPVPVSAPAPSPSPSPFSSPFLSPFAPSRPSDLVTLSVQFVCTVTGFCERSCRGPAKITSCLQRCGHVRNKSACCKTQQNRHRKRAPSHPSARSWDSFECISDLCSTRLVANSKTRAYTSEPASPHVNIGRGRRE